MTGFTSGALPGPNTQTTVQIVVPDEAGVVQGRFVKTDGVTGIANAQVRLSAAGGEAYDTTAADGSFHFDGVPKGAFTLEAFDPVTARRGRSSGQIVVNLEQVTTDIVEVPQGLVKGVVLFSNGRTPVAGADVSIAVASVFGAQLQTTSGVDGTFRFPGVSAGSFSVSAQDPLTSLSGSANGSLASEGEEVEVAIVITVPALGRVEGVVTRANGGPAIGAQVSLAGRTTTVDNTGFYFFDAVPVGAVSLLATAAIGQDAGVGAGAVAFDGDVEHIDIHFTGTGTVTGTVHDGAGTPVAFAHVALNSRSVIGASYSTDTLSALDGSFQFGSVPVGDASVTAVQAVTQLAGSASGSIPTDGATIDLPVMLQPSGAVAGCVVRQDGVTPAVGMALELIGDSQHFGSTGPDGCFQFTNLSLGTYALTVTDPLGSGIVRSMVTLVTQGQVVNVGTLTLDEAAPQVVSVTPSDGQINVPVTQVIEVLFSEPVDPTSIKPSTVQVTSAGGPVAGSLGLDTTGERARFSPSAPYRDFERISVKVTTGVEDLVGKPLAHEVVSSFVTADSTPPSTLSFSPVPSARDVALNAVVRVVYSEAVDPTAFAGPPIAVSRAGVQLNGRTDFLFNNTVVVFTPNVTLLPNNRYDVSLLPAADVFGNRQSQGRNYAFSTLDTIAPTVGMLTAVGGPSVLQNATAMIVADTGAQNDVAFVEFLVGGQVVSTDRTAPYTLALPVTASGGSSIVVSARATDLSGNVGALTMLTLTVQPDAPPTVEIVFPGAASAVDTGSSLAIAVHASDDFGITRVGLQVNGSTGATFVDAVSPATLMHDSMFSVPVPASAAPGSLVLRAAAVDTGGQSASSAPVTVIVNDATPPVVQITNPANGTRVDPGDAVTVQVAAQDNGQVSTIRLIAAGVVSLDQTHTITPTQSSATTSFQLSIPTTATGQDRVTLTAEAVDGNGNKTSSTTTVLSVRDHVAPLVSLAVQGGLTQVPRGRSVTVSVAATDEVGVTNVGFQTTGVVAVSGSTGVAPPRASTSVDFVIAVPVTAAIGSTFDVVGTATDGAGNIGTSLPVSLTVTPEVTATLSVMKQGNGTGTVTSSPAGIDCGTTCSQTFTSAVTLHLTASANPGSVFVGWGGDCSGATTSIDVTIAADTTCSATFALAGVVFDATADFSLASNPNDVWSYGATPTLGALILYATGDLVGSVERWHLAAGIPESLGVPVVVLNPTTQQMAFHPGPNGEFSVIRFTAPDAGDYQIDVTFGAGDSTTTDVHVLAAGSSVFAGAINGVGANTAFNGQASLLAGDTIDFAVGAGGNGFFSDTTLIHAKITQQTPVTLLSDNFDAENGGMGAVNYTAFVNWNVVRGSVDLFGNGFFDFLPGNGLYVELDGNTLHAGKLETKTTFTLDAGLYELQFDVGNNDTFGTSTTLQNTVMVSLGTVYSESLSLNTLAPFSHFKRFIVVTAPTSGTLSFDHAGGDNVGLQLDNVRLLKRSASLAGDIDRDGLTNADEVIVYRTDPLNPDTDGDGLRDSVEVANGLNPRDPADAAADSDGDGISNAQEIALGTGVHNPDSDGDGLTDGQEVNTYGTNPLLADSDGDGFSDGVEIASGSDPLNPTSVPPQKSWVGGDPGAPTQWSNPNNWAPPGVPTAGEDVLIPGTAVTDPVLTANASVRNLIVQSGATVSVGNFTLTATGNVLANGAISGAGVLQLTGTGASLVGTLRNVTVSGTAKCVGPVTIMGDLTVTNGGDLDVHGQTVTVSGNFSIPSFSSATLTMQEAASVLSVGGSVFVDGGDTQGRLTAGVLEVGGNFASGSLNAHAFAASGTHLVVFNGTAVQTVTMGAPGVTNSHFEDVEIANAAGVNFNSGIQMNGNLTVDAGAVMGGTGTVTVVGNATTAAGSSVTVSGLLVGGVLTIGGTYQPGTATFSGAGQVIPAGHYHSVTVSGTARVGGPVTITGDVTVTNGGDLDVHGQTVTVSGNFSIPSFSSATLTMQEAASVLSVGGSVFVDGGDTQGRLTAGVLEVGGNFASGSLNAHAFAASGTHLVVFNGTAVQTVTMGAPGATNSHFEDVEIANAAGVNFNSGIQMNGNLTVDAGAVMGGTGTVTAVGNATTAAGSSVTVSGLLVGGVLTIGGTYQPGTATFSGAGQVIPAGHYHSVTVSGTARVGGPVTITGDLAVTNGGDLDVHGQTVTVSGNFSIPSFSSATLTMQEAASVLSVGGSVFVDGGDTQGRLTAGVLEVGGNFASGSLNAHAFAASGTHLVVFNGTAVQTVTMGAPGATNSHFEDVEIANAAGVNFNSGIQMNGNLTVDAGAVMGGTGTVTAVGNATTAAGSSVTVSGLLVGGVLTIGGTYQPGTATFSGAGQVIPAGHYHSVTVSGTARVGGPVTITGDVTVTNGGDLDVHGQTVTVSGNFSIPSFSSATLTMQDAASVLSVGGSVFVDGGDTQGRLTAGVLEVGGNFASGSLNAHAFAASGTHLVVFNGTAVQTVTMGAPGATNSHFEDVEIANAAGVNFNSGIQMNGNLTVDAGAVMGGTGTVTAVGNATTAAGSSVTVSGLLVGGVLTIGGTYQPGTATFSGAGQVIPAGHYHSVTVSGTARVGGPVTITGDLTVTNGGDLDVHGQTVTVSGNFSIPSFSSATLTMQEAASVLSVGGSVFVDGGDTQGRLTAGVLEVGGNFASGSLNAHAFAASGTHLVVFNGTAVQTVTMGAPGVTNSHFEDVEIANAAGVTMNSTLVANGQLVSTAVGMSTPLLLANGSSLIVTGLDVDGLVLDNVILTVNGGIITGFDNVDFQNYSTAATQLTINHTAMNATFTGLTFFTTPTTGLYIAANDTDGPATVAMLTIASSNPVNGLPHSATSGGFVLNWLP